MDRQPFPLEIVENIIDFIPYSPGKSPPDDRHHKHTLLTCALVSRIWNAAARRCLVSQFFPSGHVKVAPTARDIFILAHLFQSPHCTLQPKFINILTVTQNAPRSLKSYTILQRPTGLPEPPRSFFVALSTLNPTLFSSLHTIIYLFTPPPFDKYGYVMQSCQDVPAPKTHSGTIFPQIKTLKFFESDDRVPFVDITHAIQLCPFVEEVSARCPQQSDMFVHRNMYPLLLPPTSITKLNMDMNMLLEFVEWFMNCGPNHTAISSLSVSDFEWGTHNNCSELWEFLDRVGPDLEELDLEVHGAETEVASDPFIIRPHDEPFIQLTKNASLKRFIIRASLDVMAELLPYFFKHTHFAPQIQTLEIVTSLVRSDEYIPLFSKLTWLDQNFRSRQSLYRIVVSYDRISQRPMWYERDRDLKWREVETQMRTHLPWCEENHLLEFERSPWNSSVDARLII